MRGVRIMIIPMLQIEPTTRCNLRCTYCTKKEPIRDLTVEVLVKILDKHPDIKIVKLQGLGEPFLTPYLTELCKVCKSRGKYVTTITNGTIINWDALHYIDRVMFSIDSLDEDRYHVTRPNASLQRVLHNLHGVREITSVGINQVITADTTTDEINDVEQLCRTFGLMHTIPRMENWNTEPDENVVRERKRNGAITPRAPGCPWGKHMFYYDALGRLHPCCIRMNDEYVIKEEEIEDFLRTKERSRICARCPD